MTAVSANYFEQWKILLGLRLLILEVVPIIRWFLTNKLILHDLPDTDNILLLLMECKKYCYKQENGKLENTEMQKCY